MIQVQRIVATLQQTAKGKWMYSNKVSRVAKTAFGQANTDSQFGYIVVAPSVQQENTLIHMFFINAVTESDVDTYRKNYGSTAVIRVDDDGADLITVKQNAQETAQESTQPSTQPTQSA